MKFQIKTPLNASYEDIYILIFFFDSILLPQFYESISKVKSEEKDKEYARERMKDKLNRRSTTKNDSRRLCFMETKEQRGTREPQRKKQQEIDYI